jgi:hypothetical protein
VSSLAASAEDHFGEAKAEGADTARYRDPLAETAFARAKALLDEARGMGTSRPHQMERFAEAGKALGAIEAKYADTPWFAEHKGAVKAARDEVAVEKLYAQAAKLYAAERLFDLKPVVEKLRTDYADTPAATDATRNPTIAEMREATEGLGTRLIVRKDGKGDFTTLAAALKAAEPRCLVEIADSGVYRERIEIPEALEGLTLRGRSDRWPIVTSLGAKAGTGALVQIKARDVTVERLVLSDLAPTSNAPCIGKSKSASARLRSAIVYGNVGVPNLSNCVFAGNTGAGSITNCIQVAGVVQYDGGRHVMRNCVLRRVIGLTHGHIRLYSCTVVGEAKAGRASGGSYVGDSIVEVIKMDSERSVGPIVNTCVFGERPFRGRAKPGRGCFSKDPQFRDPEHFDYRLKPTSPCKGKASDGGDIGCRFTPQMLEMLKLAQELRKRGIIKF